MHPSPKATIVIPTFNRATMVSRAIESALAQSVPCEVIVCDHGSTDNTPEIVELYSDRVRYIRRNQDHGPFFAWLDGIVNASAEFIHLTYDDDWISERFIERCLEVFDEDCGFVFTSVKIHEENQACSTIFNDIFPSGKHSSDKIEKFLLGTDLTISPGCGVFRKKDAVRAINVTGLPLINFEYHGAGPDLLMYLLPLLKYPRFGFINEPLAHFLAHPDSITMDAGSDPYKMSMLKTGYDEVKKYYLVQKFVQKTALGDILYWIWFYNYRIKRVLTRLYQLVWRAR